MNSAQAKLTAAQFDLLCDEVRDCVASVAGCTRIALGQEREIAHLRRAMAELAGAVLARKNDRLEARRATWIGTATRQLIQFSTNPENDSATGA